MPTMSIARRRKGDSEARTIFRECISSSVTFREFAKMPILRERLVLGTHAQITKKALTAKDAKSKARKEKVARGKTTTGDTEEQGGGTDGACTPVPAMSRLLSAG